MEYFLSDEHKMIVDLTRKIANEKIKPVREHYDETGEFPWPIIKELAASDLCGVYIPQEYGGFGGGVTALALITEELSKVDGGIALAIAATGLGTLPIIIGGSDAHNVGDIGCCVTDFEDGIGDEKDLVAALREGRYKAVMNSRYFEIWGGNNGR